MSEDKEKIHYEYSRYRLEKAQQDLKTAKILIENNDYLSANNRAYYSIFHSLRAVLALDHFDSKRHSGIISEFNRRYIKTSVFPKEMSRMINDAFEIRNASDYEDMYIASKEETKRQIENANYILNEITEYLGRSVERYKEMFNKEGDGDSQILNFLLVSLFSSDTLITIEDCNKSERELMKIKWAIEESNLSEERKSYWIKYAKEGMEICISDRRDMEDNLKQ